MNATLKERSRAALSALGYKQKARDVDIGNHETEQMSQSEYESALLEVCECLRAAIEDVPDFMQMPKF